MVKRTGGQVNPNTGRVEQGRMPAGTTDRPATVKKFDLFTTLKELGGRR